MGEQAATSSGTGPGPHNAMNNTARVLSLALLAGSLAGLAPLAQADEFQTVLGAGVGAVTGAVIGRSIGGRNGAILGAGAGGLVGASLANQRNYAPGYAPNPYPYPVATTYYQQPTEYYQQPVTVYQVPQPQYRVVQPVTYYQQPVYVAPQSNYYWREEYRHHHHHHGDREYRD